MIIELTLNRNSEDERSVATKFHQGGRLTAKSHLIFLSFTGDVNYHAEYHCRNADPPCVS